MPRNGSGTYTLPEAPFVPGTTISAAAVNSDLSDLATAMTGSIASDGQTPMTGQFRSLAGSSALPGLTFSGATTSGFFSTGISQIGIAINAQVVGYFSSLGLVNTGNVPVGVPIGTIVDYAGDTAPTGWLLCSGQNVLISVYGLLFGVIGTRWGAGTVGVSFALPDLRGRATVGRDDMGGTVAGRITFADSGIDGTMLSASGGDQDVPILQPHLPNVNFTVSGITLSDPGHAHNYTDPTNGSFQLAAGGVGTTTRFPNPNAVATTSQTTGITVATQGSAASGGSGARLIVVQPSTITNKIIFAGA